MERSTRCKRCKKEYKKSKNLGTWHCRHHPGAYWESGYACCQRKISRNVPSPRACTPCDHGDDLETRKLDLNNPDDLSTIKALIEMGVKLKQVGDEVHVWRCQSSAEGVH
jgi:hypothetical protein